MKRLTITILALLLLTMPAWAALPSYTAVWEVRPGVGSDTNGGGFITGASGTDMSLFDNKNAASCTSCQSATVNISTTDAVGNTTTTISSATGNFSSAIVGNVIRLNGGSCSLTAGNYQVVTFTDSSHVVLDRTVTTCTGLTMNIGGAITGIAEMNTRMSLTAASGAWVKATNNISLAATQSVGGTTGNTGLTFVQGYTSTRGDGGQVTFIGAAGIAGGNSFMINFSGAPYAMLFKNFIVDCNNLNFTRGININSNYYRLVHVDVKNCSDAAYNFGGSGGRCERCTSTNVPSSTASHSTTNAWVNSNVQLDCFSCAALNSTVAASVAFSSWCGGISTDIVVANFTGSASTAISCGTQEGVTLAILGGVIYNVAGDGFVYGEGAVDERPLLVRNLVISDITGYCFNKNGALTMPSVLAVADSNVCNTTGATGFYNNWPAGTNDITITKTPFIAPGSLDFRLNNTKGGGADIRAKGGPSSFDGGLIGKSYRDPGIAQHQDPKFFGVF